jgi:hypothetical protein
MSEAEAVSMLTACRDLLARIEASGQGIYYEPIAEDQPIIKGVMRLCVDYGGYEDELTLELVRKRAGLSPSGWAMVHRMVEQHTLRLPGVAERRIEELRRYFGPERGL